MAWSKPFHHFRQSPMLRRVRSNLRCGRRVRRPRWRFDGRGAAVGVAVGDVDRRRWDGQDPPCCRNRCRCASEFVDGAWLVELAPVSEAAACAVRRRHRCRRGPTVREIDAGLARRVLSPRGMLLILDNCEHLIDEVADLVSAVESRCPGVKVLATSPRGPGATRGAAARGEARSQRSRRPSCLSAQG